MYHCEVIRPGQYLISSLVSIGDVFVYELWVEINICCVPVMSATFPRRSGKVGKTAGTGGGARDMIAIGFKNADGFAFGCVVRWYGLRQVKEERRPATYH